MNCLMVNGCDLQDKLFHSRDICEASPQYERFDVLINLIFERSLFHIWELCTVSLLYECPDDLIKSDL